MAYDPEWDEAPPMEIDELYRKNALRVISIKHVATGLVKVFIDRVLQSKEFVEDVFAPNISLLPEETLNRLLSIARACAKELFDRIIDALDRRVDSTALTTIAAACISIAVKLLGAHDWIYDERVLPSLLEEARSAGKTIDVDRFYLMESDILARTDWRGCSSTMDIDKIYDELFRQDLDMNETTEEDYRGMRSRGREMLRELERDREERIRQLDSDSFELIVHLDTWYLISDDGTALSVDDLFDLELPLATVRVDRELIREIAHNRGITVPRAEEWLIDRVLGRGFNIQNITLQIV